MTRLFIDYNDQVFGRGRYRVRPALQPNGMPDLRIGTHVLISDPDEDGEIEAVMDFDQPTKCWVADTAAAAQLAPSRTAEYAR
jgi:hypothetical protein